MANRRPWSEAEDIERRELLNRLERGEGTTEEAERWVARLKEIDPLFHSSDYMLGLERRVRARRILDQLTTEMGDTPTRGQLVGLVVKLRRAAGTEEENDAWLELIKRNVPDPEVVDLIFHSEEDLTAEEVIARAFAYRPIILGPATEPQ
jgi:hypothetical protein